MNAAPCWVIPKPSGSARKRGIVLPCPFCGGPATMKTQNVQYGLSGTIISCKKCMVQLYSPDQRAVPAPAGVLRNMPIENHKRIGIGRWNTRPAPPIGRCASCACWDENTCECAAAADIEVAYHRYTEPDFFCGDYEPKGGEENG